MTLAFTLARVTAGAHQWQGCMSVICCIIMHLGLATAANTSCSEAVFTQMMMMFFHTTFPLKNQKTDSCYVVVIHRCWSSLQERSLTIALR